MSHTDTTEEKALPATPRKLRELRKKGQIPRSADMVAGATTSAALIFLWLGGGQFIQNFKSATIAIANTDTSSFNTAADRILKILAINLGLFVIKLTVLVILVVIVTNFLVNRGFLFSMAQIKFDFGRLNLVDGFKRIFSIRSLIEISKNISKISLFLFLSSLMLIYNLNAPFYVPLCGPDCLRTTFSSLVSPILVVAIAIFFSVGILDIGIQRWLFLRQQRMTKTEAKRERKEEEGSPEVRAFQRRSRQRILQQSNYTLADATIFMEGSDVIVGIRFVRGETPIPIVVCKARGNQFSEFFDFAIENKIPTYRDNELAEGLFQKIEPGHPLTEPFFEPFIRALQALNLL